MKGAINFLTVILAIALASCETAPTPILSAGDMVVEEGTANNTVSFQVSLNDPAPKEVTFDYSTVELTALENEDFIPTSGTATIPKGESTTKIDITLVGDEENEGDENFWISYSNGTNVNIPEPFNTIIIENDDFNYNPSDSGYSTPNSYPGFNLVWSDEFSGTSLNTDDWNYETGASGWGNEESQFYRSGNNNTKVENGYLVITAKEESFGGAPFTSSRLTTQGNQSFKYGRIDIRARLPYGQGLWPALWMLGDNFSSAGWPTCGELDIMELIGGDGVNDRTVHGTAHWAGNGGAQASHTASRSLADGKFADQFHVFSIIWDQNSIKWYIDDIQYHSLNIGSLNAFHQPFFFIFNIAVEGDWPGPIGPNTQFPQFMVVDYVRVFQS